MQSRHHKSKYDPREDAHSFAAWNAAPDGDNSDSDSRSPRKAEEKNVSYVGKDSRDSEDSEGGGVDLKAQLKEIKKLALRIEGPLQKHPSSGKGLFRKAQDRYIAMLPDRQLNAGELEQWKAGNLSWWESLDAYRCRSSQPPKGSVAVKKIAKVGIYSEDRSGKSVLVKHKVGQDMQELILVFPVSRDAEEWSYSLYKFISTMRGQGVGES